MFSFQNLLQINKKDGSIEGPMSPVLMANNFSKFLEIRYHGLVRIRMDEEINNWYEDQSPEGRVKTGLTGCDQLVLITKIREGYMLSYAIDMGSEYMPVATKFSPDDYCTVTPIYLKDTRFEKKLSKDQLNAMFDLILKDESLLKPKS